MIDVEQTIIAQYSNSPTLVRLIQNLNKYMDPRSNFDQFFDYVWNVDTAKGFGLEYWGRIVGGVSRSFFAGTQYENDDDVYRELVLLKALSNITSATIPAINQLLRNWLGSGIRAYVNDLGDMRIRYTIEQKLEAYQVLILTTSGIFLRPAGVNARLIHSNFPVFGFKSGGSSYTGFNQAAFIAEDATHAVE